MAAGITAGEAARSGFDRAGLQLIEMRESRWIPAAFLFLHPANISRE
jgi:hypothetical protein